LIVQPPDFVAYLSSDNQIWEQVLELKSLVGNLENIQVEFDGPKSIEFSNVLEGNYLKTRMKISGNDFGDYEGRIIINQNNDKYTVPFLIHYTEGSISASQDLGKLFFNVYFPGEWSFAKITITNSKNAETQTTSATPSNPASITMYENGLYWIQGKIKVNDKSLDVFDIIQVDTVVPGTSKPFDFFDLPERQIGIIAVMLVIVGLIGVRFSRPKSRQV